MPRRSSTALTSWVLVKWVLLTGNINEHYEKFNHYVVRDEDCQSDAIKEMVRMAMQKITMTKHLLMMQGANCHTFC